MARNTRQLRTKYLLELETESYGDASGTRGRLRTFLKPEVYVGSMGQPKERPATDLGDADTSELEPDIGEAFYIRSQMKKDEQDLDEAEMCKPCGEEYTCPKNRTDICTWNAGHMEGAHGCNVCDEEWRQYKEAIRVERSLPAGEEERKSSERR